MKKSILFIAFTLMFSIVGFAQEDMAANELIEAANSYEFNPEVKEGERLMSEGQLNAYSMVFKNVKRKDIEKAWHKHLKKNNDAKTKYDKKRKIHFTDNAKIREISENTIDVYTSFREVGPDMEVIVWYDLGGSYLSSYDHPQKSVAIETILGKFAAGIEKNAIEGEIKGAEKTLGKKEGNLKDLVKDKSNLEKDIEKFEKKIEEAKKKIEENVAKQATTETEIATQKTVVEAVKSKLTKLN